MLFMTNLCKLTNPKFIVSFLITLTTVGTQTVYTNLFHLSKIFTLHSIANMLDYR